MIRCDVLNYLFNLYSVIISFEKNTIYMEMKIHHNVNISASPEKQFKIFSRNLINFCIMMDIINPTIAINERFHYDFQYRSRILT